MELYTTVNGPKMATERAEELKSGKTVASTLAIGKMIKPTVRGDSFIPMVTYTTENGSTIRPKVEVLMSTWTVPNMSETGKKIDNMDMESRPGLITPFMKAFTSMVRSTVSELLSGLKAPLTSVNFITTVFTERVCTHGPTTENTRVNGEPTKCTVTEHLLGLMVENMLVSTPMTRRRGMENSFGQMVDAIEENGSMVNSMAKEHTLQAQVQRSMVSGKMEKESDGSEVVAKIE